MSWELVIGIICLAAVALIVWAFFLDDGELAALIGVGLLAFFGIVGLALVLSETACDRFGTQVDRDTQFFAVGGCFVTLDNGRIVPIDEDSLSILLEVLDK